MNAAANVAEAAAARGVAGGLAGMLAGGGGGGGAPPAGQVILAPPVGKTLHPRFRLEIAQALIALGLSLEFEVADAQVDLIIPMSIEQHATIVKELVKVAWPRSKDTAEKFGDRVKMWESLDASNLRAVQLFAVEAIATNGRVPKADVAKHMEACLDTLMRKHDFDIGARRRELLADRNTTDVVEALKAFLGDRYVPNAAELYKILCEDQTTYEGFRSMGLMHGYMYTSGWGPDLFETCHFIRVFENCFFWHGLARVAFTLTRAQ
jgi:hypothetical protein